MTRIRRLAAWIMLIVLLLGVTPAYATETMRYYGDVNRDGVCTTADVRCLLAYTVDRYVFDDEQVALADHNEDGIVGSTDARSILLAVMGGVPEKPYTPPAVDESLLRADAYNGEPYVVLDNNIPRFTDEEKQQTDAFEVYAPLDALGRCGTAYANLCQELMPTEDRESISSITPTGWHNRQYDHIAGGWVYNRCHIIGFQLAGEQANKQNLITGTRYMNIDGMLLFENMIADYIKETDNHVLYRATPVFLGDNLLAEGIRLEAWSVEDGGESICVHVFCYNVQPGVVFDYATGENRAADDTPSDDTTEPIVYILNIRTKKFHLETCGNAASITEENRAEFIGDREELIAEGYSPCGNCKP